MAPSAYVKCLGMWKASSCPVSDALGQTHLAAHEELLRDAVQACAEATAHVAFAQVFVLQVSVGSLGPATHKVMPLGKDRRDPIANLE